MFSGRYTPSLAHPRGFDPCKLSAIASTRALRAQPARNLRPSRPADVVVVLEVMGQFMHFDGVEPCFLKILHRHLVAHIAPRPSPPCANDTVMQCMHEIV